MERLKELEDQIIQYQTRNRFGSGMVRVIESQITLNQWDKEIVIDTPFQAPGNWIYWATLQLDFVGTGGIKPPYMIIMEAEVNGKNIVEYPWFGDVDYTYTGQMAYAGVEPPFLGWIPELGENNLEFISIGVSNFSQPPSARYKIKVYSTYECTIQITREKQRDI